MEAVNVGMSIEDNYFDKLDPKDLKKGDESDDEPDLNVEGSELIIYEPKNPYLLRSLPYLIGSKAYLDNDHVGLKDLDSEDEAEDEDEPVKVENIVKKSSDDETSEDDEKPEEKNVSTQRKQTMPIIESGAIKKPSLIPDLDSDDSDNYGNGLFGGATNKKVIIKIFFF